MTTHQTAMITVGLLLILSLAHVLGRLARRCGQPAVLGEILAGVHKIRGQGSSRSRPCDHVGYVGHPSGRSPSPTGTVPPQVRR